MKWIERSAHWTAIGSLCLIPAATPAATDTPISAALIAKVNTAVDEDARRLTAIFKDLHPRPEIGVTETRMAAIRAMDLKALGFSVTEGIGKAGLVGVLRNGPGPTVSLCADMDSNSHARRRVCLMRQRRNSGSRTAARSTSWTPVATTPMSPGCSDLPRR